MLKIHDDFFETRKLMQELRYKSLNYYIKQTKMNTVVDLGCGFSPRGLLFKDNPSINYIGIDLPAVINELRIAGNDMNYATADMTNLASLEEAIQSVTGTVIIITEGVLSYFTENELRIVIQNIRSLLHKHNGIWITPDFYNNDYVSAIMKPIFGDEQFEKINKLLQATKKKHTGTINFHSRAVKTWKILK